MGRNKHSKKEVPTKTKLKKDPGVPRLPDLKAKKHVEEQNAAQRSAHPIRLDPDEPMASEPTLSSLAALAEQSEASNRIYDSTIPTNPDLNEATTFSATDQFKLQLRRQYIRTLYKVIDESDIIILVLDARDPEGCRSRLVEEEVRRREHEGKRLVFVLNKIDLVPRENAEAWLRYLRHTTPTLPFKSSTQTQRTNLHSRTSPALLNLLKSFRHSLSSSSSKKSKANSVTVGVVGYPNVGKSSLINSLRRAKVCGVSAEAGFTREIQSIQVERGIRVVDSPGVIFDDENQESSNILLRNVLKVEDINDPIAVVDQILAKSNPSNIQRLYNVPQFTSTLELLTMLALSSGRLHKGGTPDILASARQIIRDWNNHKIPYFSTPPEVHPSSVPTVVSKNVAAKYGLQNGQEGEDGMMVVAPGAEDVGRVQIVQEMAPAFDLGGLFSQADSGAFDYEMQDDDQLQDGIIEMDSDDLIPKIPRKRSRSPSPSPSLAFSLPRHSPLSPLAPLPQDIATSPPPSKRARLTRSQTQAHGHNQPSSSHPHHLTPQAQPTDPTQPPNIASSNPLNRRALKRDAKRSRKAARRARRKTQGGMEVDDEGGSRPGLGLGHDGAEFTFTANPDGVVP